MQIKNMTRQKKECTMYKDKDEDFEQMKKRNHSNERETSGQTMKRKT